MKLLTNEQQNSCKNEKICYIYKRTFEDKHAADKKYLKVRDYCHYTREYRGATHSICKLRYSVPKKILQFFTMDLTMIIILS